MPFNFWGDRCWAVFFILLRAVQPAGVQTRPGFSIEKKSWQILGNGRVLAASSNAACIFVLLGINDRQDTSRLLLNGK